MGKESKKASVWQYGSLFGSGYYGLLSCLSRLIERAAAAAALFYLIEGKVRVFDEVGVTVGAAAEGDADESATDNQAKQNGDYYPVTEFFTTDAEGKGTVNKEAIERLADRYFK